MGQQVVATAVLKCAFGAAPSALMVVPLAGVMAGPPAATIMDNIPMLNILPFGMCEAPTNPEVIAATAAALGVLTPMPCIPLTLAPWIPGSPTVLIGGIPALNNESICMCEWGGAINIEEPGQFTVMVP